MVWEVAKRPLAVKIGLPLLSHPEDFDDVTAWMATQAPPHPRWLVMLNRIISSAGIASL